MVPSTKGVRITGEERERLKLSYVRRYQAGEAIRSMATDTGRSYGFVQGLLKEAGVPLRARGGATRGVQAEAERAERLTRVDAVREAEQASDFFGTGQPAGPVSHPGAGARDLDRSPTPTPTLAEWSLPTPPLGVLVKQDPDRAATKGKKHKGKSAKSGGKGKKHAEGKKDAEGKKHKGKSGSAAKKKGGGKAAHGGKKKDRSKAVDEAKADDGAGTVKDRQ